ncbi:MAG: hypothetical protein ACLPYZ_07450 [Limisphaerales bacterium]
MSSGLTKAARYGAVLWVAFLFGASFKVNAAPGVEATAAANPQSGQVQTVHLDYVEVGYSFINRGLPLVTRSTPFAKEPAFAGSKVVRGTFQPGGSASNAIAFAWDRAAGKLYLDLNRNLDLTDDPDGVFGCLEKNYSGHYQTFANVRLPFKTPSGNREMLVDLNLNDYGSRPGCTAAVHSFWQGKVTLQGVECQVGVVENPFSRSDPAPDGYLLLRRWAARNEPFSTDAGSFVAFPFPRKLFYQNQACRLDCTNELSGNNARLKLQFTGEQPVLGELKINGHFIERAILQGGPYLVVLDQPETVVKVPVGKYNRPEVWLKQGDTVAYYSTYSVRPDQGITIDGNKPGLLAAGGPLTNSVSLSRHGKSLRFNYQLLGAGGEVYQLARVDRSQPPEFAVYKGDRKIASGKFEFG